MWGAIIGDLVGSVYEFEQLNKISPVRVGELITNDSFFTEETILTVAIYDAILHGNRDYEAALRRYGNKYRDYHPVDPKRGCQPTTFSYGFMNFLDYDDEHASAGNGAMARISGVGKLFNTLGDVVLNARDATTPSHNTPGALNDTRTVASAIFYARMGMRKPQIFDKVGYSTVRYEPFKRFNRTCGDTLNNCMYALFISNNFEEAIRTVLSFGGNTDTNCAIVGAMAEALYGVPEFFIRQARRKIPESFVNILDEAYEYA